ncbi:MAG: hypothetical protein B7Y45_00395 [Sphingomonas sp. 28-66-16]|nr:MAG: hypothetical protein B7Y45_00395 [Sphingomonas sp. 28-66-16]
MANGGHLIGPKRATTVAALTLLLLAASAMLAGMGAGRAGAQPQPGARFEGVASCAGTTCHGRLEGDGAVVRQNELATWQEPSTEGGAHSRAYSVLAGQRARQITATLGLGEPTAAPACLGCHATPVGGATGARFVRSDGVGCEACHGAASRWIASHYAVGASHRANVANGMVALDQPIVRATVCLDCHYGSARTGQFVTHRMMAAGHPRIAFELDLFSTLQQHHGEDADYAARKGRTDSVRLWAVGQAMAVNRAMTLFANPARASEGAFPEFTFFDCHSCHRRIFDQADRVKTWETNPARPIPAGMPPFNDENMILLAAATRVAAPGMAARLDADIRGLHLAIDRDRSAAAAAAARLAATAQALAGTLAAGQGSDLAYAMVESIAGPAIAPRFTDYEGSVQAVMAIDTLLNALVRQGRITIGAAAGIRADINRGYAAVRDPNGYRPTDFRTALVRAVASIRALR